VALRLSRRELPAALTGLRLLLAVPLGVAVLQAADQAALGLLGLAALTDLLDGSLARRLGVASEHGARFDAWADFAVIQAALLAAAYRGIFGYWPAGVAALCFFQFVWSSRGGALRYDPVGRAYGGVLLGAVGTVLAVPDSGIQAVVLLTVAVFSVTVVGGRILSEAGFRDRVS
jgi:phosphatidylglycerophosphate synthase